VQTTKVELHQFRWDSDNNLTHNPIAVNNGYGVAICAQVVAGTVRATEI
jgi:hypothetical protein